MVKRVTEPEHPTPARPRTEYIDRLSHEKNVMTAPDYYTAFLFRVGKYDNLPTLESARDHALTLRNMVSPADNPRDVMIYAVKGVHQTLVTSLTAKGTWKDPK